MLLLLGTFFFRWSELIKIKNNSTTNSLLLRLLCGVRSIHSSLGHPPPRPTHTYTWIFFYLKISHNTYQNCIPTLWVHITWILLPLYTTSRTLLCLVTDCLAIVTQISWERLQQCSCPHSISQSLCLWLGPLSWASVDFSPYSYCQSMTQFL